MPISISPMSGVPETIQNAQTDLGNGVVLAIPSAFKKHTFTITGSASVASGAVIIESSDDYSYAGAWAAPAGGPVAVVASTKLVVNIDGIFDFLRARISTAIGSGTVTVTYEGAR